MDFVKYAFQFAHEADPDAQLYYNDYGIEAGGWKADKALEVVRWLKSEGVPIHGFGMQWHINISRNVRFMVTELDIAVPMRDGLPINPDDIQKQATLFRSILQYTLHFSSQSPIFGTWGFTDRYNWLPAASNYTKGNALLLDKNYQPKPSYWQVQEELARVLLDGIYRITPKTQVDKCLGTSMNSTSRSIKLFTGNCNNLNQKWNVTWLVDGTYRLTTRNEIDRALSVNNVTSPNAPVQTTKWIGATNQGWVLTNFGNNLFSIVPRTAWQRPLSMYQTSNIGIVNDTNNNLQSWLFTLTL
ncbi:hypothetical protein I4U23_015306 [Adineta vaga]|nr:hypothetical protein I4U23_015306 [Adineta vaga]